MPDDQGGSDKQPQPEQNGLEKKLVAPPTPAAPPDPPSTANAQPVGDNQVNKDVDALTDRVHKAERWMIWLTAAIVFVGICQVVAAVLQWSTMNKQLGEMKGSGVQTNQMICVYEKQLTAMRRQVASAQLLVGASNYQTLVTTKAQAAYMKMTFTGIPIVNEGGKNLEVSYRVQNVGGTSARNVQGRLVAYVWPREEKKLAFKYSDVDSAFNLSIVRSQEIATLPLADQNLMVQSRDVTPAVNDKALQDKLKSGEVSVVLYGKVSYTDIFGVSHWSHICNMVQWVPENKITKRLGRADCDSYNQEDDNSVVSKESLKVEKAEDIPEVACSADEHPPNPN